MGLTSAERFWMPLMIATLVAAAFGAILERNARSHSQLLAARAALEGKLSEMRRENERLRAERIELFSSLAAIERAAREDLGLAMPGEELAAEEPPVVPVPMATAATELTPLEAVLMAEHLAVRVPAATFVLTAVILALWNAIAWAAGRTRPQPVGGAAVAPRASAG